MGIKRKTTTQLQRAKGLDFQSPDDDAWYSVRLLKVKEGVLRVMYLNFPEDVDEIYFSDQFESTQQIDELLQRFRCPAQQLQDSQCREVTKGMVVLACHTFPKDECRFYDATVDAVSRSAHKYHEVCTCVFHVTWRLRPAAVKLVADKHANVRTENICLIQDLPLDDPILHDFIAAARKSLQERIGNPPNSSPHSAKMPGPVDLKSSDSSHDEETGHSYEAVKPQSKSKGEASTELPSKGLTNGKKGCYFFWVDNMDKYMEPHEVVNFLQRELSVSSQVVLFPNMFLANTCSGAIYVESKQHAGRVLKLLKDPNIIIVSLEGRPWVMNKKCCGMYNGPMPWQEMNVETDNKDDSTEIKVLRPGSEGYEQASKRLDLCREHCEHVERLKQSLISEDLKLCNTLPNGVCSSK